MFWIQWLELINVINSAEGSLCQLNKLLWSLYKLYKLANCWQMYFKSNASHLKLFLILLSYLPNPRNLSSLWDSRRCVAFRRRPKMVEFIPTTFRMHLRTEREAFYSSHESKTRRSPASTSRTSCYNNNTTLVQLDLCLVEELNFKTRNLTWCVSNNDG